jgi:hypothetical protein
VFEVGIFGACHERAPELVVGDQPVRIAAAPRLDLPNAYCQVADSQENSSVRRARFPPGFLGGAWLVARFSSVSNRAMPSARVLRGFPPLRDSFAPLRPLSRLRRSLRDPEGQRPRIHGKSTSLVYGWLLRLADLRPRSPLGLLGLLSGIAWLRRPHSRSPSRSHRKAVVCP